MLPDSTALAECFLDACPQQEVDVTLPTIPEDSQTVPLQVIPETPLAVKVRSKALLILLRC